MILLKNLQQVKNYHPDTKIINFREGGKNIESAISSLTGF